MATRKKRIYKVVFNNQDKTYEIYAKSVNQGAMFGFVEVEGLLFGEKSTVVVDPAEETLQREFANVHRTYIPLHAVVRIDEVEKEGVSRITEREKGEGTLTPFPAPIYPKPGKDPGKS